MSIIALSAPTRPAQAPAFIRQAATLIERHGYRGEYAELYSPGLDVTTAVRMAIAGHNVAPRDLTTQQAEHLAEVLDHLDADLGCPVVVWERIHAADRGEHVAWRLRMAARRYEREMRAAA